MDKFISKRSNLIANMFVAGSVLFLFLATTIRCTNIEDSNSVKITINDSNNNKLPISPVYNPSNNSNNNNTLVVDNTNSRQIITSASSVIPIKIEPRNNVKNSSKNNKKMTSNKSQNFESIDAPRTTSLPWPASLNFTRALVNKSLRKLKGRLEKAAAENNNRRGSRGPLVNNKNNTTNNSNSVRSFTNTTMSSLTGKSGYTKEPKQSWLAVASAVAHSTAAETNEHTNNPLNDDASSKPTKYHYYPHNQHLYLLPECATQQVCSAVYLRLNYSQPLCACPTFHEPCSVSTRTDDRHTIPLVTGSNSQVLTLVKTCEPTQDVRECRAPKDWSILALQNSRTGKAHYLVICRCPSPGYLEGPIAHSQPAYARVPGIRVYGMTCVRFPNRTGKTIRLSREHEPRGPLPNFPWYKLKALFHTFE